MGTAIEPIKEQERQFFQMAAENIGVKYGIDLMVDRVRQMVHVKDPKRQQVTVADVAAVVTEAMAKHLDPLKGGLYAFKDKDDRLIIGTTKRGFQQALASQPTYRDLKFMPIGELREKIVVTKQGRKKIEYYDAVKCVIRKHFPDGSDGYVEGTAYFDEEFNEVNAAWVKSPRRLLDGRAMCIASSNAYGWGAYDAEEAGRAMGFNVEVEPESGTIIDVDNLAEEEQEKPKSAGASRVTKALKKAEGETIETSPEIKKVAEALDMTAEPTKPLGDPKTELVRKIRDCKNRQELEEAYLSAPAALKGDEEIIKLFKAVASCM